MRKPPRFAHSPKAWKIANPEFRKAAVPLSRGDKPNKVGHRGYVDIMRTIPVNGEASTPKEAPASNYHHVPQGMRALWTGQATLVQALAEVSAIVQTEHLKPNTCDEVIDDEHHLCRTRWQQFRQGKISECPECGEFKPATYPPC